MSIPTSVLDFFRDQWDDRFTDTVVIKGVSGQTLNTTTGVYATTYSTTYEGGALVRPARGLAVQSGQQQTEVRMYEVYVPYTTTSLLPDLLVDVTSDDAYLNGRQLVVRNVRGDTYTTVRRLDCEDTQNV